MKLFKKFILLISALSFAFQSLIAVQKLFHPPTVLQSETVKISEIDPPLMTVCPSYQKLTQPDQTLTDSLKGIDKVDNGTISWGGKENKTMAALVEDLNSAYSYGDGKLKPSVRHIKAECVLYAKSIIS